MFQPLISLGFIPVDTSLFHEKMNLKYDFPHVLALVEDVGA